MNTKKLWAKIVEDFTPLLLLGTGGLLLLMSSGAVMWHFQFGGDLPWLNIKNEVSAQYWGQIGDFFGGVLNPLLSFLALVAISLSLRSQTAELKSAREEAATSQTIQNLQTKVYERQSFESVFFGLLQIHSSNLENMRRVSDGASGRTFFSQQANSFSVVTAIHSSQFMDEKSAVLSVSEAFMQSNSEIMAHYFRTLRELLDYVDSYGRVELKRTPFIVNFAAKPSAETEIRMRYARILRSVLSSAELHLIFLYCITPEGGALKSVVEKYSLLANYDPVHNISLEVKKDLFSPTAFGLTPETLDLRKS